MNNEDLILQLLNEVRDDTKEIRKQVTDHSERIGAIETRHEEEDRVSANRHRAYSLIVVVLGALCIPVVNILFFSGATP